MIAYSLRLWGQGIASKSLEIHSLVVGIRPCLAPKVGALARECVCVWGGVGAERAGADARVAPQTSARGLPLVRACASVGVLACARLSCLREERLRGVVLASASLTAPGATMFASGAGSVSRLGAGRLACA